MNFKNFTIIGLLLLNLGLITFIWLGKHPNQGHHHPNHRIIKKMKRDLGLSDEQVTDFKKIKKEHEDFVKSTFDKTGELKNQFSKFLTTEELDSTNLEKVVKEVSDLTLARDKATILYVRNIRSLLNEEQKKKFDLRYREFIPKPRSPKPPRRKH